MKYNIKQFNSYKKTPPLCRCGCGNTIIVKAWHIKSGLPKYIYGHSSREKCNPMYGKKFTKEHRANMSKAALGRVAWNKGKTFSITSRQKMSETRIRRKLAIGKNNGRYKGITKKHLILEMDNMIKEFTTFEGKTEFVKLLLKRVGVTTIIVKEFKSAHNFWTFVEARYGKNIVLDLNVNKIGQPNEGKYEYSIFSKIEKFFPYKIERQYFVHGAMKVIDGYIKELKLAIEIDEPHHYKNGKLRKCDVERENKIKKILGGCIFWRIPIDNHGNLMAQN